jgi:hypothetical protein
MCVLYIFPYMCSLDPMYSCWVAVFRLGRAFACRDFHRTSFSRAVFSFRSDFLQCRSSRAAGWFIAQISTAVLFLRLEVFVHRRRFLLSAPPGPVPSCRSSFPRTSSAYRPFLPLDFLVRLLDFLLARLVPPQVIFPAGSVSKPSARSAVSLEVGSRPWLRFSVLCSSAPVGASIPCSRSGFPFSVPLSRSLFSVIRSDFGSHGVCAPVIVKDSIFCHRFFLLCTSSDLRFAP